MTKRLKTSIIQMLVLTAVLFLIASCGDTQPRQETQDTHQETEEQKEPSMTDVIVEQAGEDVFYDGENSFSEEYWVKMKSLTNSIVKLREDSEERAVSRDALTEVFQEHGFDSIDQGRPEIRKFAELHDLILDLTMMSSSLRTARMMRDEAGVESTTDRIKRILNNRKITKEDLAAIESNLDVIGKSIAVQFIIQSAK